VNSDVLPRILVVDDDPHAVEDFIDMLGDSADCAGVYSSDDALAAINSTSFDLVLLDYHLGDGISGEGILKYMREREISTPVIMISKNADFRIVRKAWHGGADDFLGKTPTRSELRDAVERCLDRALALRANEALRRDMVNLLGASESWLLSGTSAVIQHVNREIVAIAPTESRVLITGETGTGKERVARALHELSKRKSGPYVAVNCGAISAARAESELFGHVAGAFTGAVQHRRGRFEEAQGGTLFLDEVGEMSPDLQVMLLRVLEEREFRRMGGNSTIKSDVRLVCATNADLDAKLRAGLFRNDLLQRIRVETIHVPPLRDRREDISALTREFLNALRLSHGKQGLTVSEAAQRALLDYGWPGNIRELQNTLERAARSCDGGLIDAHDLPARVIVDPRTMSYTEARDKLLEQFHREYWPSMWKICGGNKTEMQRISGITRQAIDKILKKYGIDPEDDGIA